MLPKIDNWLISRPYQGVVDLTQKQPVWWIEQCGFMLFVFAIMKYFVNHDAATPLHYLLVFLDLVTATFAFWFARMPAFLRLLAQAHQVRIAMLILSVISILHDFSKPWEMAVVSSLYDLASMSVYYFAACQPPQPRQRRHQHVTAN